MSFNPSEKFLSRHMKNPYAFYLFKEWTEYIDNPCFYPVIQIMMFNALLKTELTESKN